MILEEEHTEKKKGKSLFYDEKLEKYGRIP